MIKRFFIAAIATAFTLSSFAVVNVADQAALIKALSGEDKNITITKNITTSTDITINEGYVVTLGDGVKLTLGTIKILNKIIRAYKLTGSGTVVTGTKKIVTTSTRTLPNITPKAHELHKTESFNGATYDVTKVESTGGSISYEQSSQLSCQCKTSISVDGGETWEMLDFEAKAVICNVTSGLNGGRSYYKAYKSFEEAYNDAKFGSSQIVTSPKVVFLLSDGAFEISSKITTVGLVVDGAGNSASIQDSTWGLGKGEYAGQSFFTFLNAKSAKTPKLTNSYAVFINCENASVYAINDTCTTHVYDCGTVDLKTYPEGGGAYFYCGGPYNVTFNDYYKVYGGKYINKPNDTNFGSVDLEAVPDSNGYWVVQEKKPVVKVAKIGDTTYETLQTAVDAATTGAKIELISSVKLESPVVVNGDKDITLELAGFDVVSDNGAIINNGSLKLEYSLNYDEPSSMSTTSGNVIENNGTLEVTYGEYVGNILLNSGLFIVHNGIFTGEIKKGANVKEGMIVADLRGGRYKNSVVSFLSSEYCEKEFKDYKWVGKFPYAILEETTVLGADKGWSIKGLSDSDYLLHSNSSKDRNSYTDQEWYQRAELLSRVEPYEHDYFIDCVVRFNRSVKAGSVRAYGSTELTFSDELNTGLDANEDYRALSTAIAEQGYSQVAYWDFISRTKFTKLAAGIENLSDENDGTTCTIEFQLCHREGPAKEIVTDYVIASKSYQFPIHYVTVALPTIDNATWVYNGETVSGSITVQRGSNVELTLNAADGYQFADGQISTTVAINKVSSDIANNNVVFNSIVPPKKSVLFGSGTEADPFLIMSLEDLVLFRDSVNNGETKYNATGVYVALGADIDMSSVDWSVNIGDAADTSFDGIFDGKSKKILNLHSVENAKDPWGYICTGLFGCIAGNAQIKNLTLENVNITAEYTGNNVAALVGFAYNCSGAIDNVTVKNVAINAANATGVGAIVGYDYYSPALKITNCTVDGTSIKGAAYVGGVIGYASTKIELNNNTVKNLTLNGTASVGGVAGIMLAGGSASGNTAEKVQLSATGEMWANSIGLVAGTITTGSVTVAGTTATDCAVTDLIGGILVEKPTSPIEKIQVQIGGSYFTTLDAAINAAKAGDTIKLLTNVGTDAALVINKELTVDLNGKTIAATEKDKVGDGVFCVVAGGELTINDSLGTGVINGVGDNDYNIAIWANGGKVIINGGNFTNVGATDKTDPNAHFDLIYAKNGGEVIINGGTFECETPEFTLNSHDTNKGNITVNGGTFVGFDPRNNAAETTGTTFMAAGMYTFAEGGNYIVVTPEDYILNGVSSDSGTVNEIDSLLAGAVTVTKDGEKYVATATYTFKVTAVDTVNPEKSSYELTGGTLRPGKTVAVKYIDLTTGDESWEKLTSDTVTFKLVIK